jgi:MYXO-CTERM domain-containing protein
LSSINGGMSYATSTIALAAPYETDFGAAYVSAADPSNPDRLYARIDDGTVDRLVVSDDGARTFYTVFQGNGPLLAFALSSDGSKVYVGGPRDGVQLASAYGGDAGPALAFVQRSTAVVSCLTWHAAALYACMAQTGSRVLQQVGVSDDDGASFTARFLFGCVTGAASCADSSPAALCEPRLPFLGAMIGGCPDGGPTDSGASSIPDASNPDGASDAGPQRPPSSGGCGCDAGEGAATGGLATAVILLATASRRRRRRLRV